MRVCPEGLGVALEVGTGPSTESRATPKCPYPPAPWSFRAFAPPGHKPHTPCPAATPAPSWEGCSGQGGAENERVTPKPVPAAERRRGRKRMWEGVMGSQEPRAPQGPPCAGQDASGRRRCGRRRTSASASRTLHVCRGVSDVAERRCPRGVILNSHISLRPFLQQNQLLRAQGWLWHRPAEAPAPNAGIFAQEPVPTPVPTGFLEVVADSKRGPASPPRELAALFCN